jgi:integrase
VILPNYRPQRSNYAAIFMALTDRTLRNAKPRDTVYRLRDGNSVTKGFGVTVAPAGSKTFFLSYTSPANGNRTQVNLGRYPGTSLKEAREKAHAYRGSLAIGIDPKNQIKEEQKRELELAARPTVEALFEAYIADLEMDNKRSAPEVRRIFNKHIKEFIGDSSAAEVTTDNILDVLTPIVQRGSLVHADNVRAYLRAAFEFGLHAETATRWRGRIPKFSLMHNPVANTKKAVRRKPVGRRALSVEEVKQVWHGSGISLPSHLALKLLIATGQRVEEVLQANWREFDLAEKLWTIPAERRKNRHDATEPHIVPLTDFHVDLLEQVRAATDHADWLFPHQDREQPRKADALYQAIHRFCHSNGIESFAPRDCRRTFKTLAGSIGIDLELRNRLQGHAMTDVGSVHYDRWGYLPEKRGAMETWSDWLKSMVDTN